MTYSAWGPFKRDLDAYLWTWKAWTGPHQGQAQGKLKDHSAAATGMGGTGATSVDSKMTTVDVPLVRRGLLSPARRVPLLKSKFEIQTSRKGPLTEAVRPNSGLNSTTTTTISTIAPEQFAKKTALSAGAMRTKIPIAVGRINRVRLAVVPLQQGTGSSMRTLTEEVCIPMAHARC